MKDRARRAEWLARIERRTDRPLTLLALALVPILVVPYLFPLSPETEHALVMLDYLIWGAFAADLAVKLAIAPNRLSYLRRHWVDAVLVAVPMLRPVRAVRVLRLWWAVAAAGRFLEGTRRLVARRGLSYSLVVAVVVVLVAAGLAATVERGSPESSIRSFPDAVWWAVTTVTTVGYGDTYPVTPAGRGIGVALMLLGIALFGLVTASLAALFVEEGEDDVKAQIRRIDARLARIEEAIAALAERQRTDGDDRGS